MAVRGEQVPKRRPRPTQEPARRVVGVVSVIVSVTVSMTVVQLAHASPFAIGGLIQRLYGRKRNATMMQVQGGGSKEVGQPVYSALDPSPLDSQRCRFSTSADLTARRAGPFDAALVVQDSSVRGRGRARGRRRRSGG